MSFSLFLALPAPFKIALIILGGIFWTGANIKHEVAVEARAAEEAHVEEAVPAAKPARAVRAVPVKPAKAMGALVITVNSDGSYNLAGKQLNEAQLMKNLKAVAVANPQRKIVLKADALTPHQMVASAVKLSKSAGLTNVSFASKPEAP